LDDVEGENDGEETQQWREIKVVVGTSTFVEWNEETESNVSKDVPGLESGIVADPCVIDYLGNQDEVL
jgi:adenosine/AMP kinase